MRARRQRGPTTRLVGNQQITITIPVAVDEAARLAAGDAFRVEADCGDWRVAAVRVQDPLDAFIGAFPGIVEAADLDVLRGEWER